jgi:hypothetical protein
VAEQTATGTPERRRERGGRRTRRGLLAVVVAASMLVAGPAVAAQASTTAAICGTRFMATGLHYTSNRLLSVNLQERSCDDGDRFIVVVHNYSPNAVGNRPYGLWGCDGFLSVNATWGAYIPAGGVWSSPEVLAVSDEPSGGGPISVMGRIYRPRTSTDTAPVVEVATGCVA